MLKGMRRSAKHILWPLTIAMVITMGGFGVWHLVTPDAGRTRVGMIWGQPVGVEEFFQTVRAARAIAILSGRDPDQRELFMTAWQRILLHREAERLGVNASRRDLARFLAQWPAFQVQGRFNAERYSRVLAGLGLDASVFEREIERILAIEQLGMLIQNQALVPPDEAARTYERINEEVQVEYVRIGLDEVTPVREITEAELEDYYRANRARFSLQTRIEIEYILVEFDDTPEPGPDEPAGEEGELPELDQDPGTGEAAARADRIIRMLDYETSLTRPAEEYGLEIRSTGYFVAGDEVSGVGEVPELGRLAELMEVNEIASYPIPVPDGFLIFQLTGREEARRREFSETREEILETLTRRAQREEAGQAGREKLEKVRTLMAEEEMSFAAAAGEAGLEPVTTDFFNRQGGADLPPADFFAAAAFLTGPDEVSGLIPGEDGFYFFAVRERRPPPPMPEGTEEEWMEIARMARAEILYETWFNNLVVQSGFSITDQNFAP